MVEETGEPGKKHHLSPKIGNFFTFPGQDLNQGSGESQIEFISKALDHTTVRTGPHNVNSVYSFNLECLLFHFTALLKGICATLNMRMPALKLYIYY